jgi:ABC-type transport system involved in multi-copper enzyme maturation permease subunit
MSAVRESLRSWRTVAPWILAGAAVAHALVREFDPEGGFLRAAWIGLAGGALPLLPGVWRRPQGIQQALLGGLVLALASVALMPFFDLLAGLLPVRSPLQSDTWILALLGVWALCIGGSAARVRTLIGVEWMKLRRGRLLRVGLLVAGLATLLSALTHTPIENESGWTQAAGCLGVGFWTAEILLLVLGATAVAGEVSQGTLKMVLPHAYLRSEWIAAKAALLLIATLLFVLVVTATGLVATALDEGLGDVTRIAAAGFGEEDEVQVFQTAAVMRGYLQETILASGMSLLASGMIGLLLSCLFASLVPALSASFLVFAALKAGEMFLGLSPESLAHLYAHYPDELRQLTENFGRALNERWNETLVERATDLALITSAASLLLSMRLFARRDFHG